MECILWYENRYKTLTEKLSAIFLKGKKKIGYHLTLEDFTSFYITSQIVPWTVLDDLQAFF